MIIYVKFKSRTAGYWNTINAAITQTFPPRFFLGERDGCTQAKQKFVKIPTGRRLTSWLFSMRGGVEFGTPKRNPSSGREEDLNPGPPDYKSSALTNRPRCLLRYITFYELL